MFFFVLAQATPLLIIGSSSVKLVLQVYEAIKNKVLNVNPPPKKGR